jgi:hypothetical protein
MCSIASKLQYLHVCNACQWAHSRMAVLKFHPHLIFGTSVPAPAGRPTAGAKTPSAILRRIPRPGCGRPFWRHRALRPTFKALQRVFRSNSQSMPRRRGRGSGSFLKKRTKNFCSSGNWMWHRHRLSPKAKSFFASFCSQKEDSSSLYLRINTPSKSQAPGSARRIQCAENRNRTLHWLAGYALCTPSHSHARNASRVGPIRRGGARVPLPRPPY